MKILDILSRPWAITETKFEAIKEVYERHAAGEKFDVEGLKAAASGNTGGEDGGYIVQNGVAIIPVDGILSKRMNMLTYFSGGTSTEVLQQQVMDAAADPAVHSIILAIDSPGGEVDGVQVAAQAIDKASDSKPVIAFIDGQGDSGAYWLASQADKIYIASDTTEVGSIGVVFSHVDRSKANEMAGRKVTHITAGKYKRIATADSPLSIEGQQTIQEQVDYIHSVFVDAVAAGRGMDVEDVIATEAKVYFGQQAIKAGLADGVSSIDALVAQLNATPTKKGAISMAFKSFETESDYNVALAAEFERGKTAATVADLEKVKTDARAEGATAERDRIKAVESTPLASAHKDLIATMKFDGKSTAAEAAVAVLAAEEKVRGNKAKELADDAGNGVDASAADVKKEAEQKKKDAEAASAAASEEDPKALAGKIQTHMSAAAKDGRKLSYAQAAAEVSNKK